MNKKEEAYAKRRQEVDRLLKEGTNEKLIRGRAGEALKKIGKAYSLAHREDTPLHNPWRPLTAYRLAHLLIRDTRLNYKKLRKIDELFAEACKEDSLGLWPRFYRLAVLHRLELLGERNLGLIISEVFLSARKQVEKELGPEERDSDTWNKNILQPTCFNLLELCQYFLSLSYQLEGLGSPYADIGNDGWRIVGKSPRLAAIVYPEALAKRELTNLAKTAPRGKKSIEFILSHSQRIWRANDGVWAHPKNSRTVPLIASLLLKKDGAYKDEISNPNTWRSIRKRCREDLSKLTGLPQDDFLEQNSNLKFPKNISIHGAIEDGALKI